ncbi:MAG: TonB C-terminal domain-containing protein [Limisphaerales bacterium]
MNRLQRKCLVFSGSLHGFLLLLLLVGAGFQPAREDLAQNMAILTFVPDLLTDQPVMGGGSPEVTAPPAPRQPVKEPSPSPRADPAPVEPPKPAPAIEKPPVTKPKVAPKPPKDPEPARVDDKAVDKLVEKPKPKPAIQPNLKSVVRQPEVRDDRRQREREQAVAKAAAEAEAQRRRVEQVRQDRIKGVVSGLAQALSPGVSIQSPGPGGGGPSYANYDQFVQSIFQRAWKPPAEVSDDEALVKVRVVIGRDGSVESAEIVDKSGIATLDKSVRAVLDRVSSVGRPFPAGATEDRRSYVISFNLKARRAIG